MAPAAKCGLDPTQDASDALYHRHRYHGVDPDDACKAAHTRAVADRRRQRGPVARRPAAAYQAGIDARHGRHKDGLDGRAAYVRLLRELGVIAA